MTAGWTRSLRTKLVLIIVLAATVPLGVVGTWLAGNTRGTAERLLRSRLDSALSRAAADLGWQWVAYRSTIADLAEDSAVRQALKKRSASAPALNPHLRARVDRLRAATDAVFLLDTTNTPQWILSADANGLPMLVGAKDSLRVMASPDPDRFSFRSPVIAGGTELGAIEVRFRLASLVPGAVGTSTDVGGLLAVVNRATGRVTAPIPLAAPALAQERFTWDGKVWLTATHHVTEPPLDVVVAAPVEAFMLPFERAARTGLLAVIVVGVIGLLVATALTRRVTHSLVALSDAATAVAGGQLERRVDVGTPDEIGRLAAAFNTMTDSLRRTLAALSERQAVAAVGEFASALAHEIRNPLSAIRLNLQHAEERATDQLQRAPLGDALRDIARLDHTVAGALRLARTGRMSMTPVALAPVMANVARAALPEGAKRGVSLELPANDGGAKLTVIGNAAALEQLLLNLLLNSIEATPRGGGTGITVGPAGGEVAIDVWDSGAGLSRDAATRAFEPFFTTKPDGTGLGLSIAKRIVDAHHGRIAIESRDGGGTVVHVVLPSAPHAT